MKFTVETANKFFEKIGLNVKVTLRGKTLTIGAEKFRMPDEDLDTMKKIKWDDKVQNHLTDIMEPALRNRLTNEYEQLLNTIKSSSMGRLYTHTQFGPYEPAYIKKSIEDMKAFLEMVEQYPEFNEILDKYEAYRTLVDRKFGYIEA